MKKTLAVFFGGCSCEHDVSIITGHQVMENADRSQYDVFPIYIDRSGRWYTGESLRDIKAFEAFSPDTAQQIYMNPFPDDGAVYKVNEKRRLFSGKRKPIAHIHVALPAMHGMNGEDGTLQGFLELADIPYTSAGVMGSSLGMDKIAMHMIFRGAGLPVLPFIACERIRFTQEPDAVLKEAEEKLLYPIFVKPCNLGSSIGISRATDRESLRNALEVAFSYDRRVMMEKGLECIEVNCSAMGFGGSPEVSLVEQPVSHKELLSFGEKYLGKLSKASGMANLSRILPAQIGNEMTDEVRRLTGEIFTLLDCRGVVRIDYMIEKSTNQLYVNEINTIPGSLAYYLWEPLGISFTRLIDRIVDQAVAAQREKHANNYVYESPILAQFTSGLKNMKRGKT
ncbi:MAG: D-alanine--D-alanine ligase family protein [Christensenellales bacterium]|jgi:D-alanine-D-alanine ligase